MRSLVSVLLIALIGLTVPLGGRALAQGPCGEAATVAAGDTLSAIARRCQSTVAAIVDANPEIANPDLIFPGMTVRMPAAGGLPPDTLTHSVLPGEMLAAIAERYWTSIEAIRGANPQLAEGAEPEVGQMLLVPTSAVNPRVDIAPLSGTPGTPITVQARGYPADLAVIVGLGRGESEFAVSREHVTDNRGNLRTMVTLPESAAPGDPWVVVVQTADLPRVQAESARFTVTAGSEGMHRRPRRHAGAAGPALRRSPSASSRGQPRDHRSQRHPRRAGAEHPGGGDGHRPGTVHPPEGATWAAATRWCVSSAPCPPPPRRSRWRSSRCSACGARTWAASCTTRSPRRR